MNSNIVARQIISRGEFFAACWAHKSFVALVFNGVMLGKSILSGKGLAARGVFASEATRTVNGVDFSYMSLQLTSASKITRAQRTSEFSVATWARNDEGKNFKRADKLARGSRLFRNVWRGGSCWAVCHGLICCSVVFLKASEEGETRARLVAKDSLETVSKTKPGKWV